MTSPKKKQRQAARKKADKQASRRLQSISPVKRLAAAPGDLECWATRDFEKYGQMSIFVFKQAAGLHGIACFLIDRGVVGLKDAFTDFVDSRRAFQEMLDISRKDGLAVGKMPLDDARRWVAGAARWAHDNGMRLPGDWLRTSELIGGAGDWKTSDVSVFLREFAGHPEDLRQRLIGEPFDDYVRRTDIAFDFKEQATFMDQATGEYIDPLDVLPPIAELNELADRFTPAATRLAEATAGRLAAEQTPPSPELFEAWRSVLLASLLSSDAMPDASDEDVADFGMELLEEMADRIDPLRADEYDRGVDQALDHARADPHAMRNAVLKYGLADEKPA